MTVLKSEAQHSPSGKVRRMQTEAFKPIPVVSPSRSPMRFALRCLFDLQLATIVRRLRPAMANLKAGRILDVGAGESPWCSWLPAGAKYVGLDLATANEFGMSDRHGELVLYDGTTMPLEANSYDSALCIEVIEHVEDPAFLLNELHRVLKPEAPLLLSVPWSARLHHLPFDFHRFSPVQLQKILEGAGFEVVAIEPRGDDVGSIANKLVVACLRLSRIGGALTPIRWLAATFIAPAAAYMLVLAHLSEVLRIGSTDDPLGFFVYARNIGTICRHDD